MPPVSTNSIAKPEIKDRDDDDLDSYDTHSEGTGSGSDDEDDSSNSWISCDDDCKWTSDSEEYSSSSSSGSGDSSDDDNNTENISSSDEEGGDEPADISSNEIGSSLVSRKRARQSEGDKTPDDSVDANNILQPGAKRVSKAVVRYQDAHFAKRMFNDVPEEEISHVFDDTDPYFDKKFDYKSNREGEDECPIDYVEVSESDVESVTISSDDERDDCNIVHVIQ